MPVIGEQVSPIAVVKAHYQPDKLPQKQLVLGFTPRWKWEFTCLGKVLQFAPGHLRGPSQRIVPRARIVSNTKTQKGISSEMFNYLLKMLQRGLKCHKKQSTRFHRLIVFSLIYIRKTKLWCLCNNSKHCPH